MFYAIQTGHPRLVFTDLMSTPYQYFTSEDKYIIVYIISIFRRKPDL